MLWIIVKRTSSMAILYQRDGTMGVSMQGFADASYAGKAFDRSVSEGVVVCCLGVIAWFYS